MYYLCYIWRQSYFDRPCTSKANTDNILEFNNEISSENLTLSLNADTLIDLSKFFYHSYNVVKNAILK